MKAPPLHAIAIACILSLPSCMALEAGGDTICEDGECYPREFTPGADYQPVRSGQVIPKGLHVQIDWQTGEKRAKLAVNGDGAAAASAAVQVQQVEDGEQQPVDSRDQQSAGTEAKSSLSSRERDAFGEYLRDLDVGKPAGQIMPVLEKLEDIVHHVEWGLYLVETPRGLPLILDLLSRHGDATVRAGAAMVLGSCMQNNVDVQETVRKDKRVDVLGTLMDRLASTESGETESGETKSGTTESGETEDKVLKRLVYAVSAYTRGSYPGTRELFSRDGVQRLFKVCKRAPHLCAKIYTLLQDLGDPDMMTSPELVEQGDNFVVPKPIMCGILEVASDAGADRSGAYARKVETGECVSRVPLRDDL
ncbi:MAG: hypothetical protein SGCHY_000063 [Lobulomycetales sp.]